MKNKTIVKQHMGVGGKYEDKMVKQKSVKQMMKVIM